MVDERVRNDEEITHGSKEIGTVPLVKQSNISEFRKHTVSRSVSESKNRLRKPDAVNPHVRFDGGEGCSGQTRSPFSTLLK